MLTIPDVRQRDDFSCGAACLAALLRFHKVPRRTWIAELPNPDRGMAPDVIEAVLYRAFGRPPLRGSLAMIADLRHLTRTGRPVLCPIVAGGVGHWVVVRGVRRGRVYYHCPTNGPESMTAAGWLAAWRDVPESSPYQRFGLTGWPREKCSDW